MAFRKPPAFGKPLLARRKLGERIGLLVVGVHDWDAGKRLAERSGAVRVVVDIDQMPHELDWSCSVALDCLIVGDCDESVFYAAATMLYAAGAASLWGEFEGGIYRLDRDPSKYSCWGFVCVDGAVGDGGLGRALASYRSWALMRSAGVYGTKLFDAARASEFDKAFGPLAAKAQAWLGNQLNSVPARAA